MNPTTEMIRRSLFCRCGIMATALAAPYLIPSGVLARDGKPGVNDRIGIAVIGPGHQGSGLLGAAGNSPQARIVAQAVVNLPRAQQRAPTYKAAVYKDIHPKLYTPRSLPRSRPTPPRPRSQPWVVAPCRTGSIAFVHARSRWPMLKSAIARPLCAIWVTSPAGPASDSTGIPTRNASPKRRRNSISTAPGTNHLNCHPLSNTNLQ